MSLVYRVGGRELLYLKEAYPTLLEAALGGGLVNKTKAAGIHEELTAQGFYSLEGQASGLTVASWLVHLTGVAIDIFFSDGLKRTYPNLRRLESPVWKFLFLAGSYYIILQVLI